MASFSANHLEAAPLDQANRVLTNRLRRKPVLAAILQPEDVADEMKRTDLAAPSESSL